MLINDKYDCYILDFCFCKMFTERFINGGKKLRGHHIQEIHLFYSISYAPHFTIH